MKQYKYISVIILCLLSLHPVYLIGVERTILLGPKTIGRAWKDNIVLESRHFANAKAGDILTVYNDQVKGGAQGAFQNPATWQGVSPEYAYFGINGAFKLTLTDTILAIARTKGIAIGGHDYRILRATLTDAADYQETITWRGPSVTMKADWSVSAEIPGKTFATLRLGDAVCFHLSKCEEGAAMKLMDFTWNSLDPSLDGVPVGGDRYIWQVKEKSLLLQLQLMGDCMQTAVRVGGKGYRLDKIGIVQFVGTVSDDVSDAQHAPKEYVLQPGELYHGEHTFPSDWSGNLRLTAAPFQKCTENDVLILSYSIDTEAVSAGIKPQLSFRDGRNWSELTGAAEPVWYELDGTDVVYMFDPVALDQVKTRGCIITGVGFTLKRIELISAQ